MSKKFLHSTQVLTDLCNGCVHCVKYCPTEAIRVRGGKAEIVGNRCIDCGECIRRCPQHAMVAATDALTQLTEYKYNVALVPPSLYGQFREDVPIEAIWQGVKSLGFQEVFDLSLAGDYIAQEIADYVANNPDVRKPLISSACPAVLRMLQVQFPELIKQIIPILAPGEAAAIYKKEEVSARTGLRKEEVGIWFLTPCPAKSTNIQESVEVKDTEVSGSISITSVFARLSVAVGLAKQNIQPEMYQVLAGSSYGMGWGLTGGEIASTGIGKSLRVSSIAHVYDVLEQISMNKMPQLDYVECYACSGGCIGGAFAPENRFVAINNLQRRIAQLRSRESGSREEVIARKLELKEFPVSDGYIKPIEPRPTRQLDEDINEAIKKLEKMEQVLNELPGLDCGACGAPTCQALAEDIVQGQGHETDCIFILRSRVRQFAKGMIDLSKQLPLMKEDKEEE